MAQPTSETPSESLRKAREAVEDAEVNLAVARKTLLLVEGALNTGSMAVAYPGPVIYHVAIDQSGYLYSQARNLAMYSTPIPEQMRRRQ